MEKKWSRWELVKYTWAHKKAFLITEKKLRGKITITGLLHDFDKICMYPILGDKLTNLVHSKLAFHHYNNIFKYYNYEEMLIDWECAPLTKPDKPIPALEFFKKHYLPIFTLKDTVLIGLAMSKLKLK